MTEELMATIVLIHGGFVGSWGWQRVSPLLRAAGHTVSAPCLTGLGERVHLASPDITLDTHITDVVNHLVYEDLSDVTLVGWSYGGMVISGVAEQVPERIRQLIYLDADVPTDGQSAYDVDGADETRHREEWAQSAAAGTPGFAPAPADWIRANTSPEADPEWIIARMTPHPLATFSQPLRLANPKAAALPRTFLFCTEGKDEGWTLTQIAARLRTAPGWRYRDVAADHNGPLTAPVVVSEALVALVGD
jgi:pimeloyl-ACP methyl ester carboxylesterase